LTPLLRLALVIVLAFDIAASRGASPAARCVLQCGAEKRQCTGEVKGRLKATLAGCGRGSTARVCRRLARQAAKQGKQTCGTFRRGCRACCRANPSDTCQQRCGDLVVSVDRGEQCDPPLSACGTGAACDPTCHCSAPVCGNGTPEAGETCGEPGLECPAGVPCVECGCGTTVPSVLGLDFEGASAALAAVGLVPGKITRNVQVAIPPVGVLAQSPPAGSTVRAGQGVDLTVTYPPDAGAFLSYDVPSIESHESALAYYAAIDPDGAKTTLAAWKAANRFGAPGGLEAAAIYFNDNDLGFGRQMYMRLDNQGVAYYVSNHPTVDDAWSSPNPPLNTVAMEYSPPPGGGDPFIKFYTFDGAGNRILAVDLDGRGEKFQPEVCTPCHGGKTNALENGVYPSGGDVGARFVPFDLDSFRYSTTNPTYFREAQEDQFRALNRGVVAGGASEATLELIRGWYGGAALDGVFDGTFVPSGWRPPLAPDGVESLYRDVVKRACRGCHVQLDARVPGLGFTTFAQFEGARARITRLVCDTGDMPRAFRTFDKFWLSTARHEPTALGEFLDGDLAWTATQGSNAPAARKVVVDPTRPAIVYALGLHDVRKSTDRALSWASITNGLPTGAGGALAIVPVDLVVDPRAPDTLFLAGDGLFRSLDGGGTWVKIRDGFFTDLAAVDDQANSTTILIAVNGTTGEALRSVNGGDEWNFYLGGNVVALAFDPKTPAVEYHSSGSAGLAKRVAGLDAPINVNGGVPSDGIVDFLAVDPLEPANVYAHFVAADSTEPLAPGNGTYRSTDDGLDFAFFAPFRVQPDRFRSGILWGFPQGGLARSLDDGLSWQLVVSETAGVVEGAGADPSTFYAATATGVLRGDKVPCGRKGPGQPVAVASAARNVTTDEEVALNGGDSLPATGITWQWSLLGAPEGSTAAIADATSSIARFTPDVPGAYLIGLTVHSGDLESPAALVPLVAALAIPPVSFRNQVVPIFDADCGNCHTSGNVMDLSGDASSDFVAVSPRVNEANPAASALVRKPRGLDDHPGGLRFGFDLDGDHTRYDVILQWIAEGANDN